MATFKIGEKVICINGNFRATKSQFQQFTFPKAEKEYTIRGFHSAGDALLLEEIINPKINDMAINSEISFYDWRFIGVDSKLTYDLVEQRSNHSL